MYTVDRALIQKTQLSVLLPILWSTEELKTDRQVQARTSPSLKT